MPRYIDAETLMQKLCNQCGVKDREYFCHAHCGDRMNIENIPTADVQPVKHGMWEQISQNKFTGAKTLRCTYCKNYFVVRDDTLNAGRGDANFCPNCGARMDGDSE